MTRPPNTIVSTRVFPVPPETVYQAFADPECLSRWWGPTGFSSRFERFDLRPHGDWRFTFIGPDGQEYPNTCVFVDVDPPKKIVFDHLEPIHLFRMTMTFTPEGIGTRLTWTMQFAHAEEYDRVQAVIIPANEQNFDRLTQVLATVTGGGVVPKQAGE